ncbi:putative quinol monooxygenase [Veronia pacifica]|uniref:putative quinol monooxygenase n=1 Tax=Veronia pacifica TaxID=1080227 RepID=UPI001112F8F6|nr:antibiotic biosynthesis monooxygenase [Veronia pacifica]
MKTVTLTGFIQIPDADLEAVTEELINHKLLTRQESGCLKFEVTQCNNDPHRFDVYEVFCGQSAFEAHQRRVKASHWGKITANASRHYTVTPPLQTGE